MVFSLTKSVFCKCWADNSLFEFQNSQNELSRFSFMKAIHSYGSKCPHYATTATTMILLSYMKMSSIQNTNVTSISFTSYFKKKSNLEILCVNIPKEYR